MTIPYAQGSIGSQAVLSKGTEIMDGLMLNYLTDKPNFRKYMLAYIEEMDYLFAQINEVYYGRFLTNAEGEQLDVIGIILQQDRHVVLPQVNFAFTESPGSIDGFADEATPSKGGWFKSEEGIGADAESLSDAMYRLLLKTKAACMNAKTNSIEDVYFYITTALGFAPSFMEIDQVSTTGTALGTRNVVLNLQSSEVSTASAALAQYASKFYVPAGTSFIINLI